MTEEERDLLQRIALVGPFVNSLLSAYPRLGEVPEYIQAQQLIKPLLADLTTNQPANLEQAEVLLTLIAEVIRKGLLQDF